MSKFKGTKSKWNLQNERMIWGEVGELLVEVHPTYTKEENAFFSKPTDEYKFNAKLIVCAPELLKALKQMVKMYEAVLPCGGYQGVYENAKNVIEKATYNNLT